MSVLNAVRVFIRLLACVAGIAILVAGTYQTVDGLSTKPVYACSADDSADMGCYVAAHPAKTALVIDGILIAPAALIAFGLVGLLGPARRARLSL